MLPKPIECTGCMLESQGYGFAYPDGAGANGVLLLGEALGSAEAHKGLPFQGPAGLQLNRTLERTKYKRGDFTIYNCIQCQPPNNWLEGAPWEAGALTHCQAHLFKLLHKRKPKAIVAMGNVALRSCLGQRGIEKFRGYVYPTVIDNHHCFVVPTYHPAFIIRGQQKLTGVQAFDIGRAVDAAKDGYTEPACHYVQHPTREDLDDFLAKARLAAHRPGSWVTADIETPRSGGTDEDEYGQITDAEITCISFAFAPHQAITVPWEDYNLWFIQAMLSLPFTFISFWNADFDVPRIKAKAVGIGPKIVDMMYGWHFLQSSLPKGLGFVSTFYTQLTEWKSLSDQRPQFYSCRDSDAAIQCTLGIQRDLEKDGRWDAFLRHYVDAYPILRDMGSSGILLDMKAREEFRGKMKGELDEINTEIQASVPGELRPFKVRRKIPDTALLGGPVRSGEVETVWDCNSDGEWGERRNFLYNSSRQVIKYIRSRGHRVPTHFKTRAETTGKDEIESLAKSYPKDRVYPLILKARENHKIIGQYIDGYEPGPDGKVRTTFNRKPSTWRFNSEGPNVQNIRKRWKLAKDYRRQFVAAPGHVLCELDYKAIEAVLVGWFADDQDYIRAAKLGVHAILASHILGNPLKDWWTVWPDGEVKKVIRDLKKANPTVYDAAKMIVHMSNYMGSPLRIKMENPDLFPSVKDADELQKLYFGTIGKKIQAWQKRVIYEANLRTCLTNPYGYRHFFWDVTDGRGTLGSDAKKALAFLPQSTAAAIITEAILKLGGMGFMRKALRWQIHDSLILELPNDRCLMDRLQLVAKTMSAPQPPLKGLSIDVEVSYGRSWGEMKDVIL